MLNYAREMYEQFSFPQWMWNQKAVDNAGIWHHGSS